MSTKENPFRPATKSEARLRMAISGPSGAGKTYTSLLLASGLGDRVAVIDTEHGSSAKYSDAFAFDLREMSAPYHPRRFAEGIDIAESHGYDVLIIDSLSHAWSGEGGMLDIVNDIAAKSKSKSTFAAWRQGGPIQQHMVEAMLSAEMHLIVTLRAKQEYAIERDADGRNSVRKLGLAPVQRDGLEYEYDLFCEMDQDHALVVTKSRCTELADSVHRPPGKDMVDALARWLRPGKGGAK